MRELKLLTGSRVVIAADGSTLRGVIEAATKTFVTLVDCDDVDGQSPVPLAGFVFIPVSRIRYVQAVS